MIDEKNNDAYAAFQLSPLLEGGIYLPFNSSSLRYSSIAVLLNDIVINERKYIVELGSGLTTILIAKLIKKNKLANVNFLSIEEDINWLNLIHKILEAEHCSEYVTLLNAPLTNSEICKPGYSWYDCKKITEYLNCNKTLIDCVLVDGPSAWHKEIELSRFPALPFFYSYLNDDSIVFLDDVNRAGEKVVLEEWKAFPMNKISYSDTFTGLSKGKMFNISI